MTYSNIKLYHQLKSVWGKFFETNLLLEAFIGWLEMFENVKDSFVWVLTYNHQLNKIYMKSGRKEVSSKRSSREESKKSTSQSGHVNNIKKISCSIPLNMPTTIPSKSLMLNSHRVGKSSTTAYTKYSHAQPLASQHSRFIIWYLGNYPFSRILGRKV